MAGRLGATEDEEEYWNDSVAKGFSWEEGDDTIGMPDLSLNTSPSLDDLVSFEMGPSSSGSAMWETRVREAARQISAAANKVEPTISEVVGRREGAGKAELELKTVRRQLESLRENRFSPDPAVETVQNIILGKPYSLEMYKSLRKKEDLLDCALELGDGDAILAVTLMIRRTLKHPKFLAIICSRPLAAEHLVNYMITRHELTQVCDLLIALGRFNDAGVVAFRQAISSQKLEYKVRNLKQILHSQMSGHDDAGLVLEHINLLERTSPLLASEAAFPERQPSGLGSSVLKTLLYLTQHYYAAPENLLHSPSALVKMHRLTKKQLVWVSVRGRASALAWKDCEELLVGKGWLGGVKAKVGVDMLEMATVLHDAKCPAETLSVVLQAVENPGDRLDAAKKLGVASLVVDILLAQKDRIALTRFRDSLTLNSRDWFYAENALTTSNVKWKN